MVVDSRELVETERLHRGLPRWDPVASPTGAQLKGGYHDDVAENGYVVTARHSRKIRDVTNGDVQICSEMAKQGPRRTVVKLMTADFRLETDS